MMNVRAVLLVCILSLLHGKAAAVADSVQYLYYNINTGLPSNNAYTCMQDRLGYMWIATDNGIVKYNGHSFRIFNTYTGLPANDFYDLQEDDRGRMWIYGLTNHFGYLKDEHYREVAGSPVLQRKVGNRDAVMINRKILVLAQGGFQTLLLADSVVEKIFALPHGFYYYLNNTGILYGYRNDRRELWAADMHDLPAGRQKLDAVAYTAFRQLFPAAQTDFMIDSLLYSSLNRRIARMNLKSGQYIYRNIAAYGAQDNENIYVYNVSGTHKTTLFTGKAVYILDEQLNLVAKEVLPEAVFNMVQVACRDVDSTGNIWYATTSVGTICRLSCPNYMEPVICAVDVMNSKFVGCTGNRSYWWSNATSKFYEADTGGHTREWQFEGLGRLETATAWNDSAFFLSFNHGGRILNFYSGRVSLPWENRFFRYPHGLRYDMLQHTVDSLPNASVNSFSNIKSMSWYGTQKFLCLEGNMDLNVYAHNNGRLDVKSIPKDYCTHMVYDSLYHKYIIYDVDRLFVYDPETDSCRNFSDIQNHIPDLKQVTEIKTDRFANVYILCARNLLMFNAHTLRWYLVNTGFNLTGASVEIFEDKLVLLGNFGVAVAKVSGPGNIGPFHVSCNVRDHYYTRINNSWTDNAGNVTAQTDRGWIRVNIRDLLHTGIKAGERGMGCFSLVMNAPFPCKLHQGDTVIIAPGVKKLALDAINFYGSGAVHFWYRTADGEWQQSASGELLLDKEVPEACNLLQVRVSDNSWQSSVVTLYLYQSPYWWQKSSSKILFWIFGGIFLVLLVLFTVYITSTVVKKANEKKRVLTDLELRAIHAQINPHFIFNTLSTALYFISRKEYENAYGHVHKFSHLLRSYLKSSHDRYVLLSEEIDMLKRYVDLQQTRFEEKFDFVLSVDNKIPVNNVQIPSLLLQPLVENAINHGLFHKKEKGLLQIRFEQGATSYDLVCIIDDNGVGRDAAMQIKQESMADRESYGSKLTQKLMDIFRRYEVMDIEIQYIDKEAPHTGTVVKLVIRNIRYVV